MKKVFIVVRQDFDVAIKRAVFEALQDSLDAYPDLNQSPRPETTMQYGIFNIPSCLIGFNVDSGFWEERAIAAAASSKINQQKTVSHTSCLVDPYLVESPEILGLDILTRIHLTRMSVTTHFDAHKGLVKACLTGIKKAESANIEADWKQRLENEKDRFTLMQSDGRIPNHCQPAWN